jgi:hypothetical protein
MTVRFQTIHKYYPTCILRIVLFSFVFLLASCSNGQQQSIDSTAELIQSETKTPAFEPEELKLKHAISTVGDIPLPDDYVRTPAAEKSFHQFLTNVKLDTTDNVVHLFNGEVKANQNAHFAILDMDVSNKDLQQCADAVMRLRGEYLFHNNQKDEISFLFTNGDRVYFKQWAQGFRPTIKGNKVIWTKQANEDNSYASFRKYMELIFTYAGTLSLSNELKPVPDFEDILPGDIIIIGGSPGHAVIVMDMATHTTTGEKIFMLAQSYMPAQEIHILKNQAAPKFNPWYQIPNGNDFPTPEYFFTKDNLMRFSTP